MDPTSIALTVALEEIVAKPIAKFGLAKLKGLFESDSSIDVNLDDILHSRGGQEAVRIGLDFIKRNSGIPNEDIYKVLKSILLRLWNMSENDSEFNNLIYYADIIKELSPEELHLLVAAFKVSKQEDYKYEDNIDLWVSTILTRGGLKHREVIYRAMEKLQSKKLLAYFNGGAHIAGGQFYLEASSNAYNNLTELGYSIVQVVYNDIKDSLIK